MTTASTTPPVGRTHVKVPAVAAALGISEPTVRRLCITGEIRSVKVGKQWLVPVAEFDRLIGR